MKKITLWTLLSLTLTTLLFTGCSIKNEDNSSPVPDESSQQTTSPYDAYMGKWYIFTRPEGENISSGEIIFSSPKDNTVDIAVKNYVGEPDLSQFKSLEFISENTAISEAIMYNDISIQCQFSFKPDEDYCEINIVNEKNKDMAGDPLYLFRHSSQSFENYANDNTQNTQINDEPEQDTSTQNQTQNTSTNTPKPKKILYRVRKSANDAKSQIGAFHILNNAIELADKYAYAGYMVFDEYGTLIYSPLSYSPSYNYYQPTPSGTLYRVRKSANDAKSQIGAYRSLDSAKKLAYQRASEGYEVYDEYGNLIYSPYASSSSSQSYNNSSSSYSSTLYRVRKSANDAKSQIGAYRNFNSAKSLANQRASEGYEVYDEHGNLIYTP